MYENNSLSAKIKDIFLNHRDRFSRETFVITFTALLVFMFVTSPLLYKLCGLFLPMFIIILLGIGYVAYMIYAMFVLCIKRLHDLNMTAWLSILILIFPFNVLFVGYLCFKKGEPGRNNYGDPLDYEGPSFLLFICYAVLCLYALGIGVGLFYAKKLRNIQNTAVGVKQMIGVLPKIAQKQIQEELKNNPRAMGALFINDQLTSAAVSITASRVLVRGTDVKRTINIALREKKRVEVRFPDNSLANITKFISSDDSLSVQMAVFEIDKAIGTPAKLSDRNRQLLEKINAF